MAMAGWETALRRVRRALTLEHAGVALSCTAYITPMSDNLGITIE